VTLGLTTIGKTRKSVFIIVSCISVLYLNKLKYFKKGITSFFIYVVVPLPAECCALATLFDLNRLYVLLPAAAPNRLTRVG
jgi:hypothetical protein